MAVLDGGNDHNHRRGRKRRLVAQNANCTGCVWRRCYSATIEVVPAESWGDLKFGGRLWVKHLGDTQWALGAAEADGSRDNGLGRRLGQRFVFRVGFVRRMVAADGLLIDGMGKAVSTATTTVFYPSFAVRRFGRPFFLSAMWVSGGSGGGESGALPLLLHRSAAGASLMRLCLKRCGCSRRRVPAGSADRTITAGNP